VAAERLVQNATLAITRIYFNFTTGVLIWCIALSFQAIVYKYLVLTQHRAQATGHYYCTELPGEASEKPAFAS
jgi:hypothetical protein